MKHLIWHEKEILKAENCNPMVSAIVLRSDAANIQELYQENALTVLDEESFKFVWLVSNFLVWQYLRAVDMSYRPVFGNMYFDLIKPVISHFGASGSREDLESSLMSFLENDFNQILLFRALEERIESPVLRQAHFASFKTLAKKYDTSKLDSKAMTEVLAYNTYQIFDFVGHSHPSADLLKSEFKEIRSNFTPLKIYGDFLVKMMFGSNADDEN